MLIVVIVPSGKRDFGFVGVSSSVDYIVDTVVKLWTWIAKGS